MPGKTAASSFLAYSSLQITKPPRAAQGFVRGGGDEVRIGNRVRMLSAGHQARDVGHVHEQVGAAGLGDLAHAFKVDRAGIGAGSSRDHLRLHFQGQFFQRVIVDGFRFLGYAVVNYVVQLAGEVRAVAVGEVAAVGKVHRKNGVAGLQYGEVNGHVGLGAGVGLHVGMVPAEDFQHAVNGKLFHLVHYLAAAVPALAGIAFRIFVGQQGALGFPDGGGGEVFRGDQLNVVAFAAAFLLDERGQFGVRPLQGAAGGFDDAAFMAAAFKVRVQPCVQHVFHAFIVHIGGGQAQQVGIVMLAGKGRGGGRAAEGGAHAHPAVGGDAHADAGPADEDAAVVGTVSNAACDFIGVVGIIAGILGHGTHVGHFMAPCLEEFYYGFLEVDSGVVRADGNFICRIHDGAHC